MRHLYFLFFIAIASMSMPSLADNSCRASNSQAVIEIFDQGIALNEKFKTSVNGSDKDQYRTLRKQSESFGEKQLMPCVQRAARLLSKKSNLQLMKKLMEVVISYENSADETISYSIGSVFAANPDAVEVGIKSFPKASRQQIAEAIRAGWINVKPKVETGLAKDRDDRLRTLAD